MADVNIRLGLTAIAGGTVDIITATYDPVPTLFDRLTLFFRASGANTSTTPTFNPNSLGAKTIVKKGNQALVAGDISASGYVGIVQYNSTSEKWELLNPASDLSDTIWELSGGYIQQQDPTDNVRIGFDTNWGASRFEIFSNGNGDIPFFLGDATNNSFFIQEGAAGGGFIFTAVTGVDLSGIFTAATQAAGDNTAKLATTAYSDRVNIQSVASAATVTAVPANDLVIITAQAEALTLANPTGAWQQGQALAIRIKDDGTSRTIAYGAKFRALGTTLPTATTISKTVYLFVIYNSTDDKFDVTGVSQET